MDKIEKEKWLIKLTLTLRSFSTKIELHIPQSVMNNPSTIIFLHHHFLSDKEKKKILFKLKICNFLFFAFWASKLCGH